MITFDILTIFPGIFDSYLKESFIKRAQQKKLIKVNIHNLRDFTTDKHKTVDDRPYGGGLGMVLKVGPIFRAVSALKKSEIRNPKFETNPKAEPCVSEARRGSLNFVHLTLSSAIAERSVRRETCSLRTPFTSLGQMNAKHSATFKISKSKTKVILFTPRGKKFNQKMAYQLSKLNQIIMICGRYEGVDERVAKYIADIELSIGDYDLMGGELPAMVVIETVARLIPGVLGKPELLKERITREKGFIEYPQYTRPEVFSPKKGIKWQVPKVLLSGDHKKIEEWRRKHQKIIEK